MSGEQFKISDAKVCRPHQLAWLRRSELDRDRVEIWEKPDGSLFAHDPKMGPLVIAVLPRRPDLNPA